MPVDMSLWDALNQPPPWQRRGPAIDMAPPPEDPSVLDPTTLPHWAQGDPTADWGGFQKTRVGRPLASLTRTLGSIGQGVMGIPGAIRRAPGELLNYALEDPSNLPAIERPLAGGQRSPMGQPNVGPQEPSPMAEPNAGPQPPPPEDNSIEAVRKRLGFSWGGSVPMGENGRPAIDTVVHDPTSGRAVQAHESTGGVVTDADGVERAPGVSQSSLDNIPFSQWPESAQRDLYESYERAKRAAEAADPHGLGVYREKKAIDQEAVLGQQQAMLGSIQAQLESIDSEAAVSIERINATSLPPEAKRKLVGDISARAAQAKREYQQSVGFATGKVPASLYNSGFSLGG